MAEARVTMTDPKKSDFYYEEAIKTLRTNIQFAGIDVKTIVFTSCYPNEGKSDVVFQLAQEMSKAGKRVLILDADIRKSNYTTRYEIKTKVVGLSQYLSGQAEATDIIYKTNFEYFDIIFSGPIAPNPSELLGQDAFGSLLQAVKKRYDYVLVDTPPIGNMTDAAIVAKQCDGCVMVIENEAVSRKVASRVKGRIELTGCRILGAVLNKVDRKTDNYFSSYNHYYKKQSG